MIDLKSLRAKIATWLLKHVLPDDSPLYCEGRFTYDWEHGTELPPCEPGSYEQLLYEFLNRDPGHTDSDNVMVVIGGIGTGKSTAIRRALYRAGGSPRECSLAAAGAQPCKHPPLRIVLDFYDEAADDDDDIDVAKAKDSFWNHIAAELEGPGDAALPVEREVTAFWSWCLTQKRLLDLSASIHQELSKLKPTIRSAVTGDESVWSRQQIMRSLLSARERLIDKFSLQDMVWYAAHLLKFATDARTGICRCKYLFVDNVDHLHPAVQKLAVETAITLAEILGARTIIAVRPYTYRRSVHGYNIVRIERHRAPSIFEVLAKRVEAFIDQETLSNVEAAALRSLVAVMTGDVRDRLLRTLLDATAGYSVRFALRNFSNMFDAPALSRLSDSTAAVDEMRVSDLARAFFCGERSDLIPHAFENLYAIDNDCRAEHWLLKPRLLDILCRLRSGTAPTTDLCDTLGRFGYSNDLILHAINELLVRTRSLLWSEDGIHCSSVDSHARLSVTPIGWRYYKDLFGEVYYDELCYPSDSVALGGVRGVYDFHQRLTEQDLHEAVSAKQRYGAVFYYGLYSPRDIIGLSVLHARRMLRGIPNRIKQTGVYDPRREEWIAERFRDALGSPPIVAGLK